MSEPANYTQADLDAAISRAEAACAKVRTVGQSYGAAVRRCLSLAAGKAIMEQEAIARIMGPETERNLNTGTGRPHSYSSADEMKGTDPDYRRYLLDVAEAEGRKVYLEAEVAAAREEARLANELVAHGRTRLADRQSNLALAKVSALLDKEQEVKR